jgi:hypothetical protein
VSDQAVSPVTIAITDEILELRADEDADLGVPDLPLQAWIVALAAGLGTLAARCESGNVDLVRRAALRLAVDAVNVVEQVDRDSGRAEALLGSGDAEAVDEEEPSLDTAGPPDEPVDEEPSETNAAAWTVERWRTFLKERKVKVGDALREAQRVATERDLPTPATLDDLTDPGLAAAVHDWAEGR